MCFDWRNGFGAATGSLIISVRQFREASIQTMPWLEHVTGWDVFLGTSGVLAVTIFYTYREHPWLQESIRLLMIPLRFLWRELANLYSILGRRNVGYNERLYGGFFSGFSLIFFQGISILFWRISRAELAYHIIRVAHVSTVIHELFVFYPFRLRNHGLIGHLVRAFLSTLNVFALGFSFRRDLWERIYLLCVISSLTAFFLRLFDMMENPNVLANGRQDDGIPPPLVRPAIGHNLEGVSIPNGVPPGPALESTDSENNENSDDEENENN